MWPPHKKLTLVYTKLAALFTLAATKTLDTVFPILCLGCEAPGEWLCRLCQRKIPLRSEQRCPACRKRVTPSGETCFACSPTASLDGVFIASYYQVPLLSRAIHIHKYRFVESLSRPLGALLTSAVRQMDIPLPEYILPVPLHGRRLRFRGFNQSTLLAETLSTTLVPSLDIPLLKNGLLRTRATKPQMQTRSRKERLHNLRSAFAIDREMRKIIKGRSLWLVDDVTTTGTTLAECARVLKQSGAKSVFGIVLAR